MSILTGDNATNTRAGKVRIATNAEATAGTLETVAINPKQLKDNVSNVVGGLVYRGVYNATTPNVDLTQASKGDFYKVSVAGTLATVSLNVGDHIVFNQDASNPVTSAMFDVIDNTENISSLNDLSDVTITGGSTGEVLRHNGTNFVDAQLAYSDLSGTPTIPSSTDDLTSDHTGVNYTGALNASITTHLSGIDTALASAGGGGSRPSITEITSTPYTISISGTPIEDVYMCDTGASVVNLPTAVGNEGLKVQIKNRIASAITVNAPNPGVQQTIDGSNSVSITSQYESLTFISDNANWNII